MLLEKGLYELGAFVLQNSFVNPTSERETREVVQR